VGLDEGGWSKLDEWREIVKERLCLKDSLTSRVSRSSCMASFHPLKFTEARLWSKQNRVVLTVAFCQVWYNVNEWSPYLAMLKNVVYEWSSTEEFKQVRLLHTVDTETTRCGRSLMRRINWDVRSTENQTNNAEDCFFLVSSNQSTDLWKKYTEGG